MDQTKFSTMWKLDQEDKSEVSFGVEDDYSSEYSNQQSNEYSAIHSREYSGDHSAGEVNEYSRDEYSSDYSSEYSTEEMDRAAAQDPREETNEASLTLGGSQEVWLSLVQYSSKYRISQSTLRRRLRSSEVRHQFHEGKYFLPDLPWELIGKATQKLPDRQQDQPVEQQLDRSSERFIDRGVSSLKTSPPQPLSSQRSDAHSSVVVDGLLYEIKKAYSQILQEKEEMIIQLREEVADLRTLVRVLEEQVSNRAAYSLDHQTARRLGEENNLNNLMDV